MVSAITLPSRGFARLGPFGGGRVNRFFPRPFNIGHRGSNFTLNQDEREVVFQTILLLAIRDLFVHDVAALRAENNGPAQGHFNTALDLADIDARNVLIGDFHGMLFIQGRDFEAQL